MDKKHEDILSRKGIEAQEKIAGTARATCPGYACLVVNLRN